MAAPCPSVNIRPLDCNTDSISICLTEPVSGTFVQSPLNFATDSVTVYPGPTPLDVLPPNLDCATDSVTICPGADAIPVTGTFVLQDTGAFALQDTYSAADVAVTFTSVIGTPTQVLSLWHSAAATKTIEILRIGISVSTNVNAGTTTITLNRTNATTIPSGGTVPTVLPHDTTSAGSTVDIRTLPTTAGTTVAPFRTQAFLLGVLSNKTTSENLINAPLYEIGNYRHEMPIRLVPGVAQGISVDINTTVASLQTWTIDVMWIEY